jgi:hypothetical protein
MRDFAGLLSIRRLPPQQGHPMSSSSRTFLLNALATAASAVIVALYGCSTLSSGMGGGDLAGDGQPGKPVLFSWQSQDGGITGSMVATLPSATYEGQFVQITQQTRGETVAPMWIGWNQGWGDWPYGLQPWAGDFEVTGFSRQYSGNVIANLRNATGQHMRCRFQMNEPASGMAGGGQGECQLSGGRSVTAVIDRQG